MNQKMNDINIEEIMSQIREEIKEAGYTDDMLSFDDVELDDCNFQFEIFDKGDFNREVYDLNHRWKIQTYRNLNSGKLVTFMKKVIRKMIRFYVDTVVEDQNMFNANIVKTMNLMNCYIQEQEATIATLKNRIQQLEKEQENEKR